MNYDCTIDTAKEDDDAYDLQEEIEDHQRDKGQPLTEARWIDWYFG